MTTPDTTIIRPTEPRVSALTRASRIAELSVIAEDAQALLIERQDADLASRDVLRSVRDAADAFADLLKYAAGAAEFDGTKQAILLAETKHTVSSLDAVCRVFGIAVPA